MGWDAPDDEFVLSLSFFFFSPSFPGKDDGKKRDPETWALFDKFSGVKRLANYRGVNMVCRHIYLYYVTILFFNILAGTWMVKTW
jgi:hypothetical protein